jgi:trk system potassium uptake protein TrkH
MLPWYPEEGRLASCFLIPSVVCVVVGLLLSRRMRGRPRGRMYAGQDIVVIVLTWLVAMNACAMPFFLWGMDFTSAVFETMSGLSTTTFTLIDADSCPHILLFYRSVLLFFGGIGLVLVMVSAVSDAHGMRLFSEAGHSDRLVPNLARSARLVLGVYLIYIAAGTLALWIVGMEPFDAINHAIGALATGGFSTRTGNIAAFRSPAVEVVMVILMLLGGTNVSLHVMLMRRGFRAFARDIETRSYLITVLVACVLVVLSLWLNGHYPSAMTAVRLGVFQTVSALTTTGYSTVSSLAGWPSMACYVLTLAMVIGAETNSTGGGIKQFRFALMVREFGWAMHRRVTHRREVTVNKIEHMGKREAVSDDERKGVEVYVIAYVVALLLGSFVYTCFGYSVGDSLLEYASALSTVGLGVGINAPGASPVILWTTTFGMFIGRLEVVPVIAALAHGRDRIRRKVRERRGRRAA